MERMTSDYKQESESLQKFKKFVRLNTGNMATVLICVLFFCSAFVTPGHSEEITIMEILMSSFLGFWASTALNSLYNNKAITEGLREPEVVEAARVHNERIDIITENNEIDELDVWCRTENKKNYRNQRARILSKVGLAYSTCFTENGEIKPVEIPIPSRSEVKKLGFRMWCIRRATAKRQTKAYRKAVYLRLTELSAGELTGEGDSRNDPYNMGRGISEYKKQTAAKNTVSKIALAIVVGYTTVDLIADFSWFKLLIRTVQIVMFLVVGFTQYLSTMDYMTNEYKNRLMRKGRILLKYLSEKKKVTVPPNAGEAKAERSESVHEVSRELGNPNHEGAGTSPTDRELHATASANI